MELSLQPVQAGPLTRDVAVNPKQRQELIKEFM
jgi:hypothetical protein